jgi:hypothetical protein
VYLNHLTAASQASEFIKVVTKKGNDTAKLDKATTKAAKMLLLVQGCMLLSAVAPAYTDACQALALDPAAPFLFVLSNLNQAGMHLKP